MSRQSHPVIGRLEEALQPWLLPPTGFERVKLNSGGPSHCPKRTLAYARGALTKEADKLAAMPPKSGRNFELFRAGCRLGKYVHHGVLGLDEVEAALLDACNHNGLIQEDGLKACRDSLNSGLHKAQGDNLPDLHEPRTSDENERPEMMSRLLQAMDQGLSDTEIRADITDDETQIGKARTKWNGEGRRMRAHAKTAERQETHTNAPTDGAALLDQVYKFLGRFVSYPSEHAHVAHTLWNAHAHAMNAWESTPRLAFLSPEPGSGKTRALEVTEPLVPRPVEAVNVSPAYLFRKVGSEDGCPTILFDEIDTVFGPKAKNNEEIRGLINAGHRKGAVAGRCVVVGKQVKTEEIPAYCAVALAGLGNLPDTILTRSVVLRMRRRAPDEKVEPWRRRIHAGEGEEIRDQLALWAENALGGVIDTWPEMPDGVTDRDADVWEALLAVADVAGGDWPQRARAAAVALVTQAKESSPTLGVRLLMDIRRAFGDADKMATDAILKKLHADDEAPWGDMRGKPLTDRGLARLLNGYGIKPKVVRIGGVVARGYAREDFHEAWKRYLGWLPANSVTCVTDVSRAEQ